VLQAGENRIKTINLDFAGTMGKAYIEELVDGVT
jgi:hypothetical protein